MEMKSIGFIGGGRITKIFLKAFANSNTAFKEIVVYDPNDENLQKLKKSYPYINIDSSKIDEAARCDVLFLAVHPPAVMDVLSKIGAYLGEASLLVSLAPKITIQKMKSALNGFQSIARVNPSASGIIGQGMNPVAFCEGVSDTQKNDLISLLGILGKAPIVDESKIEAYAIISAMGSTYFWFQLQKLEELGLQYGMEKSEVKEVISEMMKGTINTLFYSGIPYDEVMDLVPVKPIGEYEETIKSYYTEKLNGIYEKIRP
jgi:pyrroline-5-carboxylate reductase